MKALKGLFIKLWLVLLYGQPTIQTDTFELPPLDGKSPFLIDTYLPKRKGIFKRKTKNLHVLLINDGQDMEALGLKKSLIDWHQNHKTNLLVVAIHPRDRIQDYGLRAYKSDKNIGKDAAHYAQWIQEVLKPYIHQNYDLASAKWSVFGCSLGGLSAYDLAFKDSRTFGNAGICSGSFWWRDAPFDERQPDANRAALKMAQKGSYHPVRFWFQAGTKDETADRNGNGIIDAIDDTLQLMDILKTKGWNEDDLTYVEIKDGEHNYETWRKVFPEFLEWCYE